MEVGIKEKRKRGGSQMKATQPTALFYYLLAWPMERPVLFFSFFFLDSIFILHSLASSHWRPDVSPIVPLSKSGLGTTETSGCMGRTNTIHLFFFFSFFFLFHQNKNKYKKKREKVREPNTSWICNIYIKPTSKLKIVKIKNKWIQTWSRMYATDVRLDNQPTHMIDLQLRSPKEK